MTESAIWVAFGQESSPKGEYFLELYILSREQSSKLAYGGLDYALSTWKRNFLATQFLDATLIDVLSACCQFCDALKASRVHIRYAYCTVISDFLDITIKISVSCKTNYPYCKVETANITQGNSWNHRRYSESISIQEKVGNNMVDLTTNDATCKSQDPSKIMFRLQFASPSMTTSRLS